MLFGRSVFQSVLTRLHREREETGQPDADAADFRIRGLAAGFVAATTAGATSNKDAARAYAAFQPEAPPVAGEAAELPPPDPAPAWLLRLSVEEIAEELAISPADTPALLAEKRRRFARANHPDSVPATWRENAGIRMKTANLLIDQALKALDLTRRA